LFLFLAENNQANSSWGLVWLL